MTTDAGFVTCIGCGAVVPDVDGAVHAYLGASPGCWGIYGEVIAREYTDLQYSRVHNLTVDSYALQHPGTPSPQTIQSAAVHLISLYFQLEQGYTSMQAAYLKQHATQHKDDYSWLEPPTPGAITILDVHQAADAASHIDIVQRWAKTVWDTWQAHHQRVHEWASRFIA